MGYLLHIAFQNQGLEPGVLMGLRSHAAPIPAGERAFILASTRKAIAEGDIPVKWNHLSKGGNTSGR